MPPVRRRRTILTLVGGVILLLSIAIHLGKDREPVYNGRSLSEWLDEYRTYGPNAAGDPPGAIRAIGAEAVPTLLRLLDRTSPGWHYTVRRTLAVTIHTPIFGSYLCREDELADAAEWAFGILGTNAAPAIPELIQMLNTNPSSFARATSVLSKLGPEGLSALVAAVNESHRHQYERIALVYSIASMAQSLGTNACLPPLLSALEDETPEVRSAAKKSISAISRPTD